MSLSALPYEVRAKIFFYALQPFPQHLQLRNERDYVPHEAGELSPGILQSSRHDHETHAPALFFVNKHISDECRNLLFKHTPLPIRHSASRYNDDSSSFRAYINNLFKSSNRIRMIDINLATYLVNCAPTRFQSFLQSLEQSLPKLRSLHITAEIKPPDYGAMYLSFARGALGFIDRRDKKSAIDRVPMPFELHLSQLLANDFCRDKLTTARILVNRAMLNSHNPETHGSPLQNWRSFITRFAQFPNLTDIEIYFDTISDQAARGANLRIRAAGINLFASIVKILIEELPEIHSIGLWMSRNRGRSASVASKKFLRRREEESLVEILGEKIMHPNFDHKIVGKRNIVLNRGQSQKLPIFDFVPGLNPIKWKMDKDGVMVEAGPRKKRKRKSNFY